MGEGTSFNFTQMLNSMNTYVNSVQTYLNKLETASSGSVDLGTMFEMQFRMQVMSQFIEACSNTLSAVNTEMLTMARATKGQ